MSQERIAHGLTSTMTTPHSTWYLPLSCSNTPSPTLGLAAHWQRLACLQFMAAPPILPVSDLAGSLLYSLLDKPQAKRRLPGANPRALLTHAWIVRFGRRIMMANPFQLLTGRASRTLKPWRRNLSFEASPYVTAMLFSALCTGSGNVPIFINALRRAATSRCCRCRLLAIARKRALGNNPGAILCRRKRPTDTNLIRRSLAREKIFFLPLHNEITCSIPRSA